MTEVDDTIQNTLRSLNEDFFTSLNNTTSLDIFLRSWASFENSIRACRDTLHTETLQMIYTLAATVSTVASNMLELQNSSDNMYNEFSADITQIITGVDHLAVDESSSTPATVQQPSYIPQSYRWLLQNLHNPYPSKDTRLSISFQTGAAGKDIDNWFIDARKRIGWNSLRKERFSNKRTDIVDAATRFFCKSDPKRPLDSVAELEFALIESRAIDLYSEKFTESILATKLDTAVKDMTLEMKTQAKAEAKRHKQLERRIKEKRARAALSYPSPERSPGSTPEPSLPPLPEQTNNRTTDDRSSRRKRRKSSLESLDCEEISTPRSLKRSRMESPTRSDDFGAYSLPSPAASLHEVDELCAVSPPHIPTTLSTLPSSKRKRRLSESSDQRTPKRPNIVQFTPRLQTASDPFPMSSGTHSFDEWYETTFVNGRPLSPSIPPAVSVEAPDAAVPLEIEVYKFSSGDPTAITETEFYLPDQVTSASRNIVATTTESEYVYNDENNFSWFDLSSCGPCGHEPVNVPDPLTSTDEMLVFNLHSSTGFTANSMSSFLPIPEWNPNDFLPQNPPSQSDALFQNHIPELLSTFSLDATPAKLALPQVSPHSCKEAKQRELLAVQQRLLALQAELGDAL